MSTTDLAQCSKCAALLNDTDEDIAKHRRWHAQLADDAEAVRRAASNAVTDVKTLTGKVNDFVRPATVAPAAAVSIRVTDDDELEPDTSDHIIDPYAGEPIEDATDEDDDLDTIYPAIDREDDLDTRLANATGVQPTI